MGVTASVQQHMWLYTYFGLHGVILKCAAQRQNKPLPTQSSEKEASKIVSCIMVGYLEKS